MILDPKPYNRLEAKGEKTMQQAIRPRINMGQPIPEVATEGDRHEKPEMQIAEHGH